MSSTERGGPQKEGKAPPTGKNGQEKEGIKKIVNGLFSQKKEARRKFSSWLEEKTGKGNLASLYQEKDELEKKAELSQEEGARLEEIKRITEEVEKETLAQLPPKTREKILNGQDLGPEEKTKIPEALKPAVEEIKEKASRVTQESLATLLNLTENLREEAETLEQEGQEKEEKLREIDSNIPQLEEKVRKAIANIDQAFQAVSFMARLAPKRFKKIQESHRSLKEKLEAVLKKIAETKEKKRTGRKKRKMAAEVRHTLEEQLLKQTLRKRDQETLAENGITNLSSLAEKINELSLSSLTAEGKEKKEKEKLLKKLYRIRGKVSQSPIIIGLIATLRPEFAQEIKSLDEQMESFRKQALEIAKKGGALLRDNQARNFMQMCLEAIGKAEEIDRQLPPELRGLVRERFSQIMAQGYEKIYRKIEMTPEELIRAFAEIKQLAGTPELLSASPTWLKLIEVLSEKARKGDEETLRLWESLRKTFALSVPPGDPARLREVFMAVNLTSEDLARIIGATGIKEATDALYQDITNPEGSISQATTEEALDQTISKLAQQLTKEGAPLYKTDPITAETYLRLSFDLIRYQFLRELANLNPESLKKGINFHEWCQAIGLGNFIGEALSVSRFKTIDEETGEEKEVGGPVGIGVQEFNQALVEAAGMEGLEEAGFQLRRDKGKRLKDWKGNKVEGVDPEGKKREKTLVYEKTKEKEGKVIRVEIIRYPDQRSPDDRSKDKICVVEISKYENKEAPLGADEVATLLEAVGSNWLTEKWAKQIKYGEDTRGEMLALNLLDQPPGSQEENWIEALFRLRYGGKALQNLVSRLEGEGYPPSFITTREDVIELYLKGVLHAIKDKKGKQLVENYRTMPNAVATAIIGQARNRTLIDQTAQKRLKQEVWQSGWEEKIKTNFDLYLGRFWRDSLLRRFILFSWIVFFFKSLFQTGLSGAGLKDVLK